MFICLREIREYIYIRALAHKSLRTHFYVLMFAGYEPTVTTNKYFDAFAVPTIPT